MSTCPNERQAPAQSPISGEERRGGPEPSVARAAGPRAAFSELRIRCRRRGAMLAGGLAAAAALAATPASAASLPAGSTAILSGTSSLFEGLPAPAGPASTTRSSVSQDGRYVAFVSFADGLAADDDDRVANVYVKDRTTGSVTLASRATGPGGEPAHAKCEEPAISDDGRRVAFTCRGPLDGADTNGTDDVYVRDLAADTTRLASRAGGLGPGGNQRSDRPSLSETGEFVAFESEATNLDPAKAGSGHVVYRRQLGGANATIIVSRSPAAVGGLDDGSEASISDDGNRIAYTSYGFVSPDPNDTNHESDVYVRDIAAATTVLASRAPAAGAVGNGRSFTPAIAGDGSSVTFATEANSFDFDSDPDTEPDVYWRSLSGTVNQQNTALVSINAGGDKGSVSTAPSVDDRGVNVGFLSQATGLDPADTGPSADAYVKNLLTNTLHVVSRADGAAGAVANAEASAVSVSGDGKKAAAGLGNGRIAPDLDPRLSTVVLRDFDAATPRTHSIARPAGDAPFVNLGGYSRPAVLSADGRFAAFEAGATGLGLPDGASRGIFVRDRVTGSVTFVSQADGPSGAPFADAGSPSISADGRRVAFAARAGSSPAAVWVRDLAAARTFLASRADGPDGAAGNADAGLPALDADGSRVSFVTGSTNLGDGDADSLTDVHVRDLDAGRTLLASRADGAAGVKGSGQSYGADLNADGTRVSFVSQAPNLGDGDTDAVADVHLRDLAAGTTRLVSADPGGAKSNGPAIGASIDASGTRVAFGAVSTNLLGLASPLSKAFVRDLGAGTLALAGRADGPGGAAADAGVNGIAISPDGGHVAFTTAAGNLAPGVPADVTQVYRRDLAGGRTELVSRRGGPAGSAAQVSASAGDLSAGGGCVSFGTSDPLVPGAGSYTQTYLRVLRADCAAGDPATGPSGSGGSPRTSADRQGPALAGARLTRQRFRVGRAATARAAALGRGTVLRFHSSEAGTLILVFERAVPGQRPRAGSRACRPAATRPRTRGCTVYRRAGTLTRRIKAGAGQISLSGRIGRTAMRPGPHRLTLTARDAAGNRSRPVRLPFTVVKG